MPRARVVQDLPVKVSGFARLSLNLRRRTRANATTRCRPSSGRSEDRKTIADSRPSRRVAKKGSGDPRRKPKAGCLKVENGTTGLAEIRENATSRANFEETLSIVEAQSPVQVTANSGVLSGLDNSLAQSMPLQPEDTGKRHEPRQSQRAR